MFPTSSNPPMNNTAAPLQTLQRIPQDKALPLSPPVLESRKKEVAKAPVTPSTVPPVVQAKKEEGFNTPVLEKTSKPVVAPRSNIETLRPSWPDPDKIAKETSATAVGVPVLETTQRPSRIESPDNLFIITCNVSVYGSDDSGTKERRIIHGIYTYPRIMEMQGNTLTEKMVTYVVNHLIPKSVPPFLRAGIGLGTAVIKVSYPVHVTSGDEVATIEIRSCTKEDLVYRTINVRRFRSNAMANLDL